MDELAKGNFEFCLKAVLAECGQYRDSPDPMNFGVSRSEYEDWVGYKVNEKFMRGMDISHVRTFYKVKYWEPAGCDSIYVGLDLCLFDFAILAGPETAIRQLQRTVGSTEDGVIGPKTSSIAHQYVSASGLNYAIMKYQDMRRDYCANLKTYEHNEQEISSRINSIERIALSLVPRTLISA